MEIYDNKLGTAGLTIATYVENTTYYTSQKYGKGQFGKGDMY